MTVVDSGKGYVNCRVDVGGKLSNRKGVNTPTVRLPISAMTTKVAWDVDVVSVSLIQKPSV